MDPDADSIRQPALELASQPPHGAWGYLPSRNMELDSARNISGLDSVMDTGVAYSPGPLIEPS